MEVPLLPPSDLHLKKKRIAARRVEPLTKVGSPT